MIQATIREQAASFLDKLREGVAQQFQADPKSFKNKHPVEHWDSTNNRPITANMEGWLPAIFPEYACWLNLPWPEDIMRYFGDKKLTWVVNQSPSPDPCFYPHYESIPIQPQMWEAMVNPFSQFLIRQPDMSMHIGFKRVSAWWEKVIKEIRTGQLDAYLIFSHDIKGYELDNDVAEDWLYTKHIPFERLLEEYDRLKDKHDEIRELLKRF